MGSRQSAKESAERIRLIIVDLVVRAAIIHDRRKGFGSLYSRLSWSRAPANLFAPVPSRRADRRGGWASSGARPTRALGRDAAIKILPDVLLRRSRAAGALRAGGEAARLAQPSEHRRGLRPARQRRRPVSRDGDGQGEDLAGAPRPRPATGRRSAGAGPSDRRRARNRPRERRHPSRSQARERSASPRTEPPRSSTSGWRRRSTRSRLRDRITRACPRR